MSALISIQNLSVSFKSDEGEKTAVTNISLHVNKGEMLAVVGESGSGKSVTAMSILQLLPSHSTLYKNGEIIFNQNNLLSSTSKDLQDIRGNKIAMIFQEPMSSLNPVMPCGKQVAEAILQHKKCTTKEAKKQTINLFKMVQLPLPEEMYHRYPHQLSGGQKQRVMIAMAMSCNPSLLICDEPTTALDVTVQKNILQLIKNLQQQFEMGVIFITHDLGVVAEIADRVAVMYKGNIVETGITKNIFHHPTHPYTKALLACRPSLQKRGERLPVVSDFINEKQVESSKNQEENVHPITNKLTTANYPRPTTLLSVKNLNLWYPIHKNILGKTTEYFKAVNDVSFEVFAGETLGLVGKSGCGKTTLGRCLLQLLPATSGEIFYKGNDLLKLNKKQMLPLRKEIQIIFQDPFGSLNPRITIGQAIAEPLKIHGIISSPFNRKKEVINWLEKVGLHAEHYDRYPHEFSGGQRQRIVIARALIMKPSFVVCDESVSALDVSVQAQVLNLLNDLKKEMGFTIIFISHDLNVVRYVSNRIMVMQKGQIEECGPADEIYFNPQSEYTKKLLQSIPKSI